MNDQFSFTPVFLEVEPVSETTKLFNRLVHSHIPIHTHTHMCMYAYIHTCAYLLTRAHTRYIPCIQNFIRVTRCGINHKMQNSKCTIQKQHILHSVIMSH